MTVKIGFNGVGRIGRMIIRSLIENNLIESCHDISSGGLILCLLEMSIGSDIGFEIETNKKGFDRIKFLFGEDQSRYMVEVNNQNKDSFENYLKKSNIIFTKIGKTSEKVSIDNDLKFDLEELSKLNKSWFYEYNN